MLEKGKEKITKSPLRFNKKDQSSVTAYQRSLQTSQRQKRREGKRSSSSPCRTPPGQRSPSRGTAAAPPQERWVREKAALHRNGDAPYPSVTAEGPRTAGDGRGRCVAGARRGPRSTQGPQPSAVLSPQPRGGRRGAGQGAGGALGWGSRSQRPGCGSRPGRAGSCPGEGTDAGAPQHRTAPPLRTRRTALTWPGPARRERAAPAAGPAGAEPPLAPGRPRPEMSGAAGGRPGRTRRTGGRQREPDRALGMGGPAPAPSTPRGPGEPSAHTQPRSRPLPRPSRRHRPGRFMEEGSMSLINSTGLASLLFSSHQRLRKLFALPAASSNANSSTCPRHVIAHNKVSRKSFRLSKAGTKRSPSPGASPQRQAPARVRLLSLLRASPAAAPGRLCPHPWAGSKESPGIPTTRGPVVSMHSSWRVTGAGLGICHNRQTHSSHYRLFHQRGNRLSRKTGQFPQEVVP